VFVPLRKRPEVARRYNADMFVSVHADAAPRLTASGASVYALSEHGASSTMSRWMAERENGADLIGNSGNLPLQGRDKVLAGVILDMALSSTIASSLDLGHSVLGQLSDVTALHQKRVEQAGFAVLKSPDIPSILVETGFISNRGDCRRLMDERHRQRLAEAIFAGVQGYFRQRPPAGSYLAALSAQPPG
ncbi:N-acetylmuramoyl-L-alanine amidase, partial [Pseudomonas aeruginosa]|nr:N-acetylmuramoyl-L-alanine amidase [Pseudomonas aeruginosa]